MTAPAAILVLGASYGMLPGIKLALAGHRVTLVGRAGEIEAMARAPVTVRIPQRRGGPDIVLDARVAAHATPGRIALATPDTVDPAAFDLVVLAMQEPQYNEPQVAALMAGIAGARRPCLSIMNLAPPPFLARLGCAVPEGVHHSAAVWERFEPQRFTLASPDPQAVRPDPARPGQLLVTLPSNFKAAPFALAEDQALLQRLASDMSRLEVVVDGVRVRPPVALVAASSIFVPLAKWPMLLAGNCRCVLPDGIRSIAAAVLDDVEASRAVYEDVTRLCLAIGAREADLVGFDAYAKAATMLSRPSSLARALEAGAVRVERVDLLVQRLLVAQGLGTERIDPLVEIIEARKTLNLKAESVSNV